MLELGNSPKDGVAEVVVVVDVGVAEDATPNESETGAKLLVAEDVPRDIPMKVKYL